MNHLETLFTEDKDVATLCIYFNYQNQHEQTVSNAIASLLRQIIQSWNTVSEKARSLYNAHSQLQTRPALSELMDMLENEMHYFSKVYIVIDALDECTEAGDARTQLLTILRALKADVNLLITSRPLDSIGTMLQGVPQLNIKAKSDDIRTYVLARMSEDIHLVGRKSDDGQLQEDIVKTCCDKADGMYASNCLSYCLEIILSLHPRFLLAKLHMDSLASKPTRRAIRKALETLPKQLDETYDQAMERITSQSEDYSALAKNVLAWVSSAVRPLTVTELQHALAVELATTELDEDNIIEEELLVSVCLGLVEVDRMSAIIRLVHFTAQDYFVRTRLKLFPEAQKMIATACLSYLMLDFFQEDFILEENLPSNTGSPPMTQVRANEEYFHARTEQYPFINYAVNNWGLHLQGLSDDKLKPLALRFLSNKTKTSCSAQIMTFPKYSRRLKHLSNVSGFHLCAWFNLWDLMLMLVDILGSPDEKDSAGQTPLMWAVAGRHKEFVRRLASRDDVDIGSKDNNAQTAFSYAAHEGQDSIVRLLMNYDIDLNSKDAGGRTPLSRAARAGHETVVKLLADRADVDADSRDFFGRTPLSRAAGAGHAAVVRVLMNHPNVEADSRDYTGWTPWRWAVGTRHMTVAEMLGERSDVDINSYVLGDLKMLSEPSRRWDHVISRVLADLRAARATQ